MAALPNLLITLPTSLVSILLFLSISSYVPTMISNLPPLGGAAATAVNLYPKDQDLGAAHYLQAAAAAAARPSYSGNKDSECNKLSLEDCAFFGFGDKKCVVFKDTYNGRVNHECRSIKSIMEIEYNKTKYCFSTCGIHEGDQQSIIKFKDIMDCEFLEKFCSQTCKEQCPSLYNYLILISGNDLLPSLCKRYNFEKSMQNEKYLDTSLQSVQSFKRHDLQTTRSLNCTKKGRKYLESTTIFNSSTNTRFTRFNKSEVEVAPNGDQCTCDVNSCSCDCSNCGCGCGCDCSCGCSCGFSCGCNCGCSCGCGVTGCYCSCGCGCGCNVGCGCGCGCNCGCACGCECGCTCPCNCVTVFETITTTTTEVETHIENALKVAVKDRLIDIEDPDIQYINATFQTYVTMDLFSIQEP